MTGIPMGHALILAGILFALGLAGLLMRRNLIFILMSIEIMLNGTGVAFIAAGSRWGQPDGQIMFLFILAMAAAASTVVSVLVTMAFLSAPPVAHAYTQVLWTWIDVGGFRPEIAFYLDPLSLIMTLVVAFVSFLIHLYSTEFMIDDDGYSRFFAYMNLFVASMLTLLLANNLLLLYLGWEG